MELAYNTTINIDTGERISWEKKIVNVRHLYHGESSGVDQIPVTRIACDRKPFGMSSFTDAA